MNDISIGNPPGTVEQPGAVNVSTVLQPGTLPEGGGGTPSMSPDKPEAPEKPESLQDVLADEMRKGKEPEKPEPKAEEKPDDKGEEPEKKAEAPAKVEPKPEAQESVKDGAKQPQQEGQDGASSEDDKSAPPARITEEAKKFWRSTPRAIKAEFQRLEGEITRMTQESGEAVRFHHELREYDGMARQNGTTVKTALDRYVNFDRQIYEDFGKGVAAIAKDQSKTPQEAITSLLRAYGTTPQQFAQAVIKNPQQFMAAPAAPRDPAIQQIAQQQQALMQRLDQQDRQQAVHTLQSEVDRWAADKPDYTRLEPAIAEILQSGIIDRIHGKGLSVAQRLDAAYRMAGGDIASPPVPQAQEQAAPAETKPDPGKKSVRGAPSDGVTPASEEPYTDIRDLLRKEMRRMA